MEEQYVDRSSKEKKFALITGALILVFGFALMLSFQPVSASPQAQVETPTETATVAATGTVTATQTQAGTMPPPAVTGTPTALVPITGADLTQPGGGVGGAILRFGLAILGLLLIAFGLRARTARR